MMLAGRKSHDFRDYYAGGFTRFPNRLFGALTPTQGATYLHLRRFENMRDGARPSVDTLAKCVGKRRTAIKDAILVLEDAGEIKRTSRGRNRPCLNIFTEVLDDQGLETYTPVPNWVLDLALSPAVLMAHVALLEVWKVDKTLRLEDIASKCRTSKSTAKKATEELERRRLIAINRPKYKIQRNRYQILPRGLSELGSSQATVRETASDIGSALTGHLGTETGHRGTETGHHVVPRPTTNKTHTQQDSAQEDSLGNKTRPHTAPGFAGGRSVSDGDRIEQNGQGVAQIGPLQARLRRGGKQQKSDVPASPTEPVAGYEQPAPPALVDTEGSSGFQKFLAAKKLTQPEVCWNPGSAAYLNALESHRNLMADVANRLANSTRGRTSDP